MRRNRGRRNGRRKRNVVKAVCWGALILILLPVAALVLYIVGMTLYFHYQLKDGRTRREYTEEQRRADSGNQGNAGKERRKASEKAAKKE